MYKLICFDMDGVLFKDFNFWLELHKKFGTYAEGKRLTEKYLHTDYDRLVEEVVNKLWKGKDASLYFELVNSIEYLEGVKEIMSHVKKIGLMTAIVSASSIEVARRVQKDFGVDFIFANELVIKNNKVSGEFVWPIGVGNENKAKIIKDLCEDLKIQTKETIYVGDSDNDVQAFKEVGLSIAFNSNSEKLRSIANYIVDSKDLKDVIRHLPKK